MTKAIESPMSFLLFKAISIASYDFKINIIFFNRGEWVWDCQSYTKHKSKGDYGSSFC